MTPTFDSIISICFLSYTSLGFHYTMVSVTAIGKVEDAICALNVLTICKVWGGGGGGGGGGGRCKKILVAILVAMTTVSESLFLYM